MRRDAVFENGFGYTQDGPLQNVEIDCRRGL